MGRMDNNFPILFLKPGLHLILGLQSCIVMQQPDASSFLLSFVLLVVIFGGKNSMNKMLCISQNTVPLSFLRAAELFLCW